MNQVGNVTQQINIILQSKLEFQMLKLSCPLWGCWYAYTLTLNYLVPKGSQNTILFLVLRNNAFPYSPTNNFSPLVIN